MTVECPQAPHELPAEPLTGNLPPEIGQQLSKTSVVQRFLLRMGDPRFCVGFTFVIGLVIALTLSSIINPLPRVHDEFSYLLGADAFSQFKTSAPTHPHWEHFESFHIIHQPRYASKYPPAQGMILAVGQWLGHPIFGSCLATAFALATVMWMMIGWIPKSTNAFVSLLLATHPGIQLHWGQSYMGGALALGAGALLLGSLFRLSNPIKVRYSILAAIGISLLMVTRPLEGAVLTVTVGLVLLYRLWIKSEWQLASFVRQVVVPSGLVLGVTVAGLLVYNASITGDVLKMPYQVHESQYGWNRLFLWQHPKETMPPYRHQVVENFYRHDVAKRISNFATVTSTIKQKATFSLELEYFFWGSSLALGLFGLPWFLNNRQSWLAVIVMAPAFLAAFMTPWGNTHYAAPVGPIVLLLGFCGLIAIWNRCRRDSTRRLMLCAVVIAHGFWFAKDITAIKNEYRDSWWLRRHEIESELESNPEKDLVFVRYGDRHSFYQEWVYNKMDIDASEVVWAREMSEQKNQELIDYFGDRRVWVVEPEVDSGRLSPVQ